MHTAMTAPEIGHTGELIVVADLRRRGYDQVRHDTKGPGKTDIEAFRTRDRRRIIVQVKTTTGPGLADLLADDEERAIVARATQLGCEAYHAAVTHGLLGQRITYRRLNPRGGILAGFMEP
jgi:hypothetical protein